MRMSSSSGGVLRGSSRGFGKRSEGKKDGDASVAASFCGMRRASGEARVWHAHVAFLVAHSAHGPATDRSEGARTAAT